MYTEVIIYIILIIIVIAIAVILFTMVKGKKDLLENKKDLFAKPIQKVQSARTEEIMEGENSLKELDKSDVDVIESIEVDQSETEGDRIDVKKILNEIEGVQFNEQNEVQPVDDELNELDIEIPEIIESTEGGLQNDIVNGEEAEEEINLDEISSIF